MALIETRYVSADARSARRPHSAQTDIRDRDKLGSDAAYLSGRYSPGNKHPGTNSILRLPGAELVKEGVRAGDLLAVTEASARTIVVRCATTAPCGTSPLARPSATPRGTWRLPARAGKPQPSQTAAVADWPCSAGPSSCLLRAAHPRAARTEGQAV